MPDNPFAFATDGQNGMTLRDYFAAKAMQAYLSDGEPTHDFSDVAQWSYQIADAMLAERELRFIKAEQKPKRWVKRVAHCVGHLGNIHGSDIDNITFRIPGVARNIVCTYEVEEKP